MRRLLAGIRDELDPGRRLPQPTRTVLRLYLTSLLVVMVSALFPQHESAQRAAGLAWGSLSVLTGACFVFNVRGAADHYPLKQKAPLRARQVLIVRCGSAVFTGASCSSFTSS